ncbi:hypothetical protein PISMIDRAFT_317518 [Pisolithus microcarpus 441]|uniref:Uncharacterized protein n=1 Tax=Pisolithus microcarpus 441 TaxID=765257 RepID=A0A0C9ZJC6_9AGAM|nr:hypothetical protein PISMIDRAFT_317518 [Pisolithus microcarpus 441]
MQRVDVTCNILVVCSNVVISHRFEGRSTPGCIGLMAPQTRRGRTRTRHVLECEDAETVVQRTVGNPNCKCSRSPLPATLQFRSQSVWAVRQASGCTLRERTYATRFHQGTWMVWSCPSGPNAMLHRDSDIAIMRLSHQ